MTDQLRVCCVGSNGGVWRRLADGTAIDVEQVDGPDGVPERGLDCLLVAVGTESLDEVVADLQEMAPEVPVVAAVDANRASAALDAGVSEVVDPGADARVVGNRLRTVADSDRTRTAARRQDETLDTLLAHSSDRLSVLDEDGTYTYVSPAVERLLGYDPEELLGTSGFEYVHPDDRDRVREAFEEVVADPTETVSIEYRVEGAEEEYRWVETRGSNRLDDPSVEGIVIHSRDITERKEREQRLREEQALTSSIFDALPDVLYAFDEAGNFIRWNERFEEVTGHSSAEIREMEPAAFVAPEDRPAVVEAIGEVFEEDTTVTVEAQFETKAGERIPYEFTGAKMVDEGGETLGLVGIGRDISDRKRRQRRFEAVFNNTYQFTGLMDPDGTLLEANETALAFGGVEREAVVGEKLWDAVWFQHSDEARKTAREAVEQARSGELYREEVTVQGETDAEIIDFSVRPMTDEDGTVQLLIPEGRTITALKRRERHLDVLHRFLRHNLRNKMTVIEGTAGLLADKLADTPYADHVTQIQGAATELTELSETAHELSQVAVETDTDRRSVDVQQTLQSVAAEVRAEHPAATIRLPTDGDQQVLADWRLSVVVEQLVENAVEHNDDDPTVDVDVEVGTEEVTIAIADDGPGIPEDELAGITTEEEQTQLTHGTGFGLWLVRSVVDDYGGDLSYEASPDGGSTLFVTLPRASETGSGTDGVPERGQS